MKNFKKYCVVLALLLPLSATWASDHIDGVPSLELHEQVDLTDLYAFKTANKPGWMTLILNLYPGVSDSGHFSRKVGYDLVLKQLNPLGSPWDTSLLGFRKEEATLSCSFTDPGHHSHSRNKARVFCKVQKDSAVLFEIEALVGKVKKSESVNIYTGSRSDAFFITNEQFDTVTKRQGFSKKTARSGDNLMERINVLSIALEVDLTKVFNTEGNSGFYSVAAESYTNVDGKKKVLDRVGRPEITNLSLHDVSGGRAPVKRAYNQTPVSKATVTKDYALFQERLISNIGAYDKHDGVVNWEMRDLENLADLLLQDELHFSLDENCDSSGTQYLSLEFALMKGEAATACGGRKIEDDIMKMMYTLYIGGPFAEPSLYETGVSVPYQSSDKKLSVEFPHLAPPEDTGFFTFNPIRTLLNRVLKAQQE
jgi:hypothetical protein